MLLVLILLGSAAGAQERKKNGPVEAHPKVDQGKVDAAIQKGLAYLKSQGQGLEGGHGVLVLWTFLHAGVPETDALFQGLLKGMVESDMNSLGTYDASLQAMILEELDRVKYQARIWECAQLLVDNMGPNGQWGYGDSTTYPQPAAGTVPKDVATLSRKKQPPKRAPLVPGARAKPPVVRWLAVRKQREGNPHDNSNSQYAALGLRACHDAGIQIPKEVIGRALKWWRDCQSADGGWGYQEKGEAAYGSMTAGAVGSVCIYDYILDGKLSWKKDPAVQKGIEWLSKNFSVTENPLAFGEGNRTDWRRFYYLYGLERAGILYETEWFGTHEWYPEGTKALLGEQRPDGSWMAKEEGQAVEDTCFAILFLRRATQPLVDVASVDAARK
jgi:hypothetical protein